MPEKNLVCKDCGATFVFTEGEQAFYQERDSPMSPPAAQIAVAPASSSATTTTASNDRW